MEEDPDKILLRILEGGPSLETRVGTPILDRIRNQEQLVIGLIKSAVSNANSSPEYQNRFSLRIKRQKPQGDIATLTHVYIYESTPFKLLQFWRSLRKHEPQLWYELKSFTIETRIQDKFNVTTHGWFPSYSAYNRVYTSIEQALLSNRYVKTRAGEYEKNMSVQK